MALFVGLTATAAQATVTYPSDSSKPNITSLLSGMSSLWQPSGKTDEHGTVLNAEVLAHNDEIATWINNHATTAQQFRALQDAKRDRQHGQVRRLHLAERGYSSYCGSGSFPSGHTTAAYLSGVTWATLLPELAPSVLARAVDDSAAVPCTEGDLSWKQLAEIGAGGAPNTVWPRNGVVGCSANQVSALVTAAGKAPSCACRTTGS